MTASNVLFEIGLEEMPARFLDDAREQLEQKTEKWLKDLRLPYEKVQAYATPRRLAVLINGVEDKQPDIEEEARGPAKKIAVDANGNWTKAAIGFSKGQGKSVEDIFTKEIKGIEYIFINKFIEGQKTIDLLPSFKEVILNLNFPKNMRWGARNLRFIRPIRWLVALYGQEVVPMEIAGVTASNKTFGHRFLGKAIELTSASSYERELKQEYVIVDQTAREQLIVEGIKELERTNGWQVTIDAELLNEVSHLVEYPTVFAGSFSEEFLIVPEEALITSMKEHQRYFPVYSQEDKLLPNFIGVRNGDARYIETVVKGNEKVIKARLSDARFFYEEDQKHSIEESLEKLQKMVFQDRLGTIADKMSRVVWITKQISSLIHAESDVTTRAVRAAEISKFDLVTHMVNEFTNLQGIMGEKYARLFGENDLTAKAINEHYMPRHAADQLPATMEGAIVSIADKLDTIVGCIAVGIIPSGSQDPYGLRRQAMGVLQIIKKQDWDFRLEELIQKALDLFFDLDIPTREEDEIREEVQNFFSQRAAYIMKDNNIDQDIVEAVLHQGVGNFSFSFTKAKVLTEKRQDPGFKLEQEALVRVLNIASKGKDNGINENLFENEFEKDLYKKLLEIKNEYETALAENQAAKAIELLSTLAEPIHSFFDHTMVMAEDESLRNNRLSLLNQIAFQILAYADLTAIQWKQQF